jgi:hypothetical protein
MTLIMMYKQTFLGTEEATNMQGQQSLKKSAFKQEKHLVENEDNEEIEHQL